MPRDRVVRCLSRALRRIGALVVIVFLVAACTSPLLSQEQDGPVSDAENRANKALAQPPDAETTSTAPTSAATRSAEMPSLLEMFDLGGPLMYPILAMSFVVVIFGFERLIALRARRVIPAAFRRQLADLAGRAGGLDPKAALRLCQQYPSATANVLRAVLARIGRPHSEIEIAMKDAADREANRLYNNVRPINLAATVAPLLGLLGTVQGMIYSFYVTANLPESQNRAQNLAEGIYMALVTTFAGLTVAIPAVMIAHYFEGRIQRIFREVDDVVLGLLPAFERFESKPRTIGPELERDKPVTRRTMEPAASATARE